MTSTMQQGEGHEESGAVALDDAVQFSQAADFPAPAPGDEPGAGAAGKSASPRAKGASRMSLSAGYIPISAKGQPSPQAPDEAWETVAEKPAPDAEAFEMLERDLADLGSFLGAPQPAADAVADPDAEAVEHSTVEPVSADVDVSEAADAPHLIQPLSHSSHEEISIMNAQAQQHEQASSETTVTRVAADAAMTPYQSSAMETDGVLHDVQSTLDSLAGMAHGLSQQKLEIMKMREALEERRLATVERERQLSEREERLSQQEYRLQEEKHGIERVAEQNAAVLAERSNALQALAETVDSRDRATAKRADVLNQEQHSLERQLNQLRARGQELDDREAGLQRQGAELADRFKQLLDAKERFGAIVKGFNETVRFNTTYSAISKSVGAGEEA